MQEIWRTVITPDGIYKNYQVSNLGNIRSLNYKRTGKEKILKQNEDGNGYLQVKLYKNGESKTYKVHRLVAMAFISNIPNYNCIDHRDTNRKNNTVLNLLWCTQEQNNNNELTRIKYSESHKGEKHSMYGKHHTEETKNKISESNKGKYISEETKNKMSESHKGKHHTEKAKKKMSDSQKGRHISEETKKKMSESHNKKVVCLETKKIFTSMSEIEKQLEIKISNISSVCNGKRKRAGKLTFRYLDQVLFYN